MVKNRLKILGILTLVMVMGLVLFSRRPNQESPPAPAPQPVKIVQTETPLVATAVRLPGEDILQDFGKPERSPAEDLTLLSHCLDSFFLVAKGMKNQPLSANGEIAAALRGEGYVKVAYLPRRHAIFNAAGELVDRWGTAFFFHAEQAGRLSVRSAGPDRELWTADDLQRQPDGSFLRGAALNPASLFPPP